MDAGVKAVEPAESEPLPISKGFFFFSLTWTRAMGCKSVKNVHLQYITRLTCCLIVQTGWKKQRVVSSENQLLPHK